MWRQACALALMGLLATTLLAGQAANVAAHSQTDHFHRFYEASSTVAWGGPGQGGGFTGFAFCNNAVDTAADTAACILYRGSNWDFRGRDFEVTLTDALFGQQTAFLVGIDLDGNNNVDCTGSNGGPDACFFGRGTVTGTIPAQASGDVMRVHPATMHSSGLLCCPQSFATHGEIEITIH